MMPTCAGSTRSSSSASSMSSATTSSHGVSTSAVGYRVHGVLPAVAQGAPGVLVAYDTRSQELAETLKIPVAPEAALAEGGWRASTRRRSSSALARSYAQSYDRCGFPRQERRAAPDVNPTGSP